jgi:hypothetical protein
VGAGLLGGELFGLLAVVEGVADLAAHGVGGRRGRCGSGPAARETGR